MEKFNFEMPPLTYDYDEVASESFLTDFIKNVFSFNSSKNAENTITKFRDMLVEPRNLFGKDPETTTIFFTLKPVIIDKKKGIISIQRISFDLLFKRMLETYGEKKLNAIFYRTYDSSDIKKFKKKRIRRGEMKITSLVSPLFFALELSILFSQLYKKYKTPVYRAIASEIYMQSWLREADNKQPEKVDISYAASMLEEKYKLNQYQIDFINAYPVWKARLNLRGIYNAFDQGLGKTLTSLSLAMALHVDKIYVVCPNTLVPNWYNEVLSYYGGRVKAFDCKNSNPDPDTKVFITNNESIKNIYPYIDTTCKTMLIVDEGHNFRNLNSSRVKDLINLRKMLNPNEVLPMSGTPLKASPNELVPAFLLLDPLFTPTAADMYNKCFNFDNYQAMEIVTSRLGKVIYRKMKSDVLALPEKTISDMKIFIKNPTPYLMVNIKEKVMKYYDEIYPTVISSNKEILDKFTECVKKYSTAGMLNTKWYLSRICQAADYRNDYSIEQMHELDVDRVTTFLSTYVVSNPAFSKKMEKELFEWESKLIHFDKVVMGRAIGKVYPPMRNEMFISMWDENEETFVDMITSNIKKTVIFSQFYPVITHIQDRLEKNGIKTVSISGKVNNNTRASNLREFKNNDDVRVIIATSQSMGTGVTLTEASQMFFFGPPWRSTDYDQCCDRIYRIGQEADVNIYNVILDTPTLNLSSRMDKILKWSSDMFHSAIDGTVIEEASESYIVNDEYISAALENEFNNAISPLIDFLNENYDENYLDAAYESGYALYSKVNKYPVFILLTRGNSSLSDIIIKVTNSQSTHASISFDISLDPLYAFGTNKFRSLKYKYPKLADDALRRILGFVKTNPYSDLWPDDFDTNYWLYVTFVNKEQYLKMQNRLEYFINNADSLRYDFSGLVRIFFGLKSTNQQKWFCSRFVAEVINAGKNIDKDPSLYRPDTLKELENTELVISGKNIKEYDVNKAKLALRKIKRRTSIFDTTDDASEAYTIPYENQYIFNQSPLFINYDKWISGENKILYITGLSGSGKGYQAKQIADSIDNTIIIELDKFENYPWFIDKKYKEHPAVAKGDKIIFEYLRNTIDTSIDVFAYDVEKYCSYMKDFYEYLLQYISNSKNTHFIIEGIQIYCDDIFDSINNDDSILIIKTSMVKSMQKVMSREHADIRNRMHTYIDFQDKLRKFESKFSINELI